MARWVIDRLYSLLRKGNAPVLTSTYPQPAASVLVGQQTPGELRLTLAGHLDAQTLSMIWRRSIDPVVAATPKSLIVDISGVTYCDGAGVGLLVELQRLAINLGGQIRFDGISQDQSRLVELASLINPPVTMHPDMPKLSVPEETGMITASVWCELMALIAFVGEITAALLHAAVHPRRIRWGDLFLTAEKAGVNALPVVALLGFLIGLIMAFQSAIPMRQFGADFLIPNIIGISMVRELGPLITAILLAGRSGSAFAAEIGTMKVTEEINALTTFGLDPTRFLVVPRVLAAIVVAPLLSVFATLMGVAGGYTVSASLGYSFAFYADAVIKQVNYVDFLGGLTKTLVFGLIVGAIGCMRGLRTASGPGAVGDSTTKAVVAGIVLIILADGVFGVLFYFLGI